MATRTIDARDRAKDLRLRKQYNLTLAEYNAILEFQHQACAICKRPARTMKMSLSVDHCHHLGLVRGLLCSMCNRALGKFADSIVKLRAAVAYLEAPPAELALGRKVISAPGRVGTKKRAKAIEKLAASAAARNKQRRTTKRIGADYEEIQDA
jgi:recombination endonuclease VII